MAITLNGTTGITTPAITAVSTGNLSYTGILTGGTGVVNLGSGQVYKDASGNVGLGVTPSASSIKTLEIAASGNAIMSTAANQLIASANAYYNGGFKYGTTSTATYYLQSGGVHSWANAPSGTAGNAITFTQAMTLDASGNLLVGGTSAFGTGVSIYGASNPGTYWRNTTTTGGKFRWVAADASNNFLVYNQNSVGVYMTDGGTTWNANSDERLKTALVPFVEAVAKVCTLRAGTGRYLTDEDTVSRSFLIAQDVQKVLPEAVNVQADEMGTLGLSYTDLIPLLTAAIQEQQALIEQQAAALSSLTTRLTALENK